MAASHLVMLLAGMLILALLLRPLADRQRVPFAAVLVLTGLLGSELLVWSGLGAEVRHDIFHNLIFYGFLPVLVFEAAFRIDAAMLWRNLPVVLFLSMPVMLLVITITAALVYLGIGDPLTYPWIGAFLTGAVLAATDTSPVTMRFTTLGVPRRLRVLMEGEDLFNDAAAIVIFGIFLYIAMHPWEDIWFDDALVTFAVVFFGGLLVGLLVGLGFLLLSRLFEDSLQRALVSVVSAYTAFLAANEWLEVSGVMAVLVTGLIMGRVIHSDFQDQRGSFVDRLWSFSAYLAEALVFLLMGVTVTLDMFESHWLAMLIGIAAALLARAVGVFGGAFAINRLPGVEPLPGGFQLVMFMGGLRGAVVLALSLSLPLDVPYWPTIQSIAFGVVIFSLFVQAPLVEPLLRAHGLIGKEPPWRK